MRKLKRQSNNPHRFFAAKKNQLAAGGKVERILSGCYCYPQHFIVQRCRKRCYGLDEDIAFDEQIAFAKQAVIIGAQLPNILSRHTMSAFDNVIC